MRTQSGSAYAPSPRRSPTRVHELARALTHSCMMSVRADITLYYVRDGDAPRSQEPHVRDAERSSRLARTADVARGRRDTSGRGARTVLSLRLTYVGLVRMHMCMYVGHVHVHRVAGDWSVIYETSVCVAKLRFHAYALSSQIHNSGEQIIYLP